MDTRRVQVTGGGTFFVTLPKRWAEGWRIGPGSAVTVVENSSGALLVLPPGLGERNRCELLLPPAVDRERLRRDIISLYIAGYDAIVLRTEHTLAELRRAIREVAQSLIGLEVLEETQHTVVLECFLKVEDFPVERTLRRIQEITLEMLGDAIAAFLRREGALAHDVVERDDDVDRLELVVARQFSLLLRDLLLEDAVGIPKLHFFHHHAVAKQLERIADHAVKISQAALALTAPPKEPIAARIQELFSTTREVVVEGVEAFLARDSARANGVLEQRERGERLFELARISAMADQPEDAHPISIVMDSLLRIREYGYNVAEIALNVSVPLGHRDGGI
ncbi:MAG TPA: phosphate uptake regulator PhoU [Candidatus Acetothermia bacterium]|nr:phosphate uptake regulator PhoU [Candidatus Acetothermia bacterium]